MKVQSNWFCALTLRLSRFDSAETKGHDVHDKCALAALLADRAPVPHLRMLAPFDADKGKRAGGDAYLRPPPGKPMTNDRPGTRGRFALRLRLRLASS